MLYESIIDTIGNTPLIKLKKIKEQFDLKANIFVKLESRNPGGSVKDRPALEMIKGYINTGKINSNTTVIEPTSGNTGIGLAMVCARLGLNFIVCMPETMSIERRKLIAAYGARLILTEGKLGMKGAIAKARELEEEIGNAIVVGQFVNLDNPKAHYLTTGPEIYNDLEGKVDILVSGIGTGGTITGISKYLKEKIPSVLAIGVEPLDSAVINGNKPGSHKLQGLGAGFIPEALDLSFVDKVKMVSNEEAYTMARLIPKLEGILVGISSGAALSVAVKEAKKEENKDKNIVVVLPDSGERYLSTDLFEE